MAMCTSGAIGIISAPQGGCSSICTAVGCASGSLSVLSIAAGKTAPHAMSEFYGYSISPIYFSNINDVKDVFYSYTLDRICGIQPNTCVGTTYCWSLFKENSATVSVCIFCNGTCIRGCRVDGTATQLCSGTFAVFTQLSTDNVCICTRARDLMGDNRGQATIQLSSLTQCVGNYCIGNPNSAYSPVGFL